MDSDRLPDSPVVLGSQSPQRKMLLEQIVPGERIVIAPPVNSEELGFKQLHSRQEIRQRLALIAREKNEDVAQQELARFPATILTADTIVVVRNGQGFQVLGKPDGANWQETVRDWFLQFYSSTTHEVVTGLCMRCPDGTVTELQISTKVHFKKVDDKLLEWYLSTNEPLGKAGGYGIQSAGSLFVDSIEGSLSNVIGLPLETVWELLIR